MSEHSSPASSPATSRDAALELGTSLRIKDVEACHRLLEQALKVSASIRIDLSRLVDIDTAGVQLLIACRREGTRLGIDVRFMGETAAFAQSLGLLGLTDELTTHAGPSRCDP